MAITSLAWRIIIKVSFAAAIALLARRIIIIKVSFAAAIALLARRIIIKVSFATAIASLARRIIIIKVSFAAAIASVATRGNCSKIISSVIISSGKGKGVERVAEGILGEIINTSFQLCHQPNFLWCRQLSFKQGHHLSFK